MQQDTDEVKEQPFKLLEITGQTLDALLFIGNIFTLSFVATSIKHVNYFLQEKWVTMMRMGFHKCSHQQMLHQQWFL